MNKITKIIVVAGARPNFMKIAPIIKELKKMPGRFQPRIVHTGQHYDFNMSKIFFEDLKIPKPDVFLRVGSGSQAEQTGNIMICFEKVVIKERPDIVLVVGDVNSTLACSLVAAKLGIPIGHIEAGLRSGDRTMPEEINRLVSDQLATWLFTPSTDAYENLIKEGISAKRIYFVGNIMADCLLSHLQEARSTKILSKLNIDKRKVKYCLLTLHRPSNVDNPEKLKKILNALEDISRQVPIIFPIHPRTRLTLKKMGSSFLPREKKSFNNGVQMGASIKMIDPLGYLEFIHLMMDAEFVVTDSGGVQEETTMLRIPCLTMRPSTERPITIQIGSNTIVNDNYIMLREEARRILAGEGKRGSPPPLWDGRTANRIVRILRGLK